MVKKFNELFENNSENIWEIDNYKTDYEISISHELNIVLKEFKTWCNENKITPTKNMIELVFEEASEYILNVCFQKSDLYETQDFDDFYEEIIEDDEDYQRMKNQQIYNI